ncbi:hypothetical protein [Pseudomonas costantinii]|uniref:Uncharacterized protein n=1 Tax=Pseudomonas costantinii TaxID=168469 RepID=A0A1S2UE09_9PSED|nr:hypothetical protein [Pseudomonas costantinii]OIN44515.1 hypothetical protein BFL40_29960 [Pseudomonas costantinii]SED26506.1 hypothetical protein SAMN04515675_0484 [Pseudomonas costantinii]
MASLTDVLKQAAAQIAAVVYPNGTGQPSVAGFPIRVYPGWPVPEQLEADLAAGIAHISVYPHGKDRSTTRYLGKTWVPLTAPVHTLTMTVSGSVVTLSGTISAQNIMINLNGTSYVYAVQQSDTLTSAATALAYLVPGASSAGPVITLTGAHAVLARVGGFGTAYKETKRQEQSVQLIVWANSPAARDAVASPLDSALSDSNSISFLDGSFGIIRSGGSLMTDQLQKADLYRIDLFYTIDYATTQVLNAAEVIAPVLNIVNAQSGQTMKTLNL